MRTWFITGISGGLGQSLAQAALAQGDRVVGTSRSAEAAARFSALDPEQALGLAVDLRDEAAIAAAVAQAEKWSGGVDVLVNNAGYGMTGAIEETSAQAVEALFAINLFAPLALLRAALPAMRARHAGHVIFITSVSGLAPGRGPGSTAPASSRSNASAAHWRRKSPRLACASPMSRPEDCAPPLPEPILPMRARRSRTMPNRASGPRHPDRQGGR
jgi:NAD(P)-dependent dehydrogenase (short-subunit alcohol dehydrogenase family)